MRNALCVKDLFYFSLDFSHFMIDNSIEVKMEKLIESTKMLQPRGRFIPSPFFFSLIFYLTFPGRYFLGGVR